MHISSPNILTYMSSSSNAQTSIRSGTYARNKSVSKNFILKTSFPFQLLFIKVGKTHKQKWIISNITLILLIFPLQASHSNGLKLN